MSRSGSHDPYLSLINLENRKCTENELNKRKKNCTSIWTMIRSFIEIHIATNKKKKIIWTTCHFQAAILIGPNSPIFELLCYKKKNLDYTSIGERVSRDNHKKVE